ncbi:MAG: hypothetical protein PVSMB7_05380 [Chloroflexota bacterium]
MRRFIFTLLALTVLSVPTTAALAAGNTSHQPRPVDWNQRDTAVYVVSTLNLLHNKKGVSIAPWLSARKGISRFDVYADTQSGNLYFVELRRDSGDIVGAFAYQMGWFKPKSVTTFTDKLGTSRAPSSIVDAYKNDSRQFLGSFTSTLPQ